MATWRETFYHCEACGSIVMKFGLEGDVPSCCGAPMQALVPHTQDDPGVGAAEELVAEHHLRLKLGEVSKVTVGGGEEGAHPMEPDHYIKWIYVVTQAGAQFVKLQPGLMPYALFSFRADIPLTVYAYCSKHGLWAEEIIGNLMPDDE